MKNKVYELKNKRAGFLAQAKAAYDKGEQDAFQAAMGEAQKLNVEIENAELLLAEEGRFDDGNQRMVTLSAAKANEKAEKENMEEADALRSGREYVQAFAHALQNGLNVSSGKRDEKCKPLYAALTGTGGTPEGADGGFLVPIDFDNMIHEERRELSPLANVFTQESVSTLTGWRAMDSNPSAGFTAVDEMEDIPEDDQPKFVKIEYKVKKYGLIVPVSRELMDDNTVGLMRYLARWFGKKSVITENKMLLDLLALLTKTVIAEGDEVKMLKRALNVTLDPAIAANAVILTNQSGFSAMDELENADGDPLMQPDITDTTKYKLFGRRVIAVSNRFLPNVGGGTQAPVYAGDMKQLATLFRRKAFEIASTNIGGNAWKTDSNETRGIIRLDAQQFDREAAVALTLPIID